MITSIGYLITSVLFILGIMFLRSPATARLGNTLSALGMAVAIIATLLSGSIQRWDLIIIGFVLGAIIGYVAAMRVAMTAMPQMVAIFNGMGGGAAALVAINEILKALEAGTLTNLAAIGTGLLTVFIGSFSFAGSGLAFAKLQELIHGRPITFPLQKPLNAVIFLGLVILGIWAVATQAVNPTILTVFTLIALLLGFLVVLPIGGADMPVVISLLNAMTGLAAATTGFLLLNNVLIVAGALVGASGTILTLLMSRAMNRSVSNILFGAFGKLQVGETADIDKTVRSTTPEDVAALLKYAEKVIIVPGFGLAVARAQREVQELAQKLIDNGVDVRFAIHPVAGRMPGHMNVLLAEANVPYDLLYPMEAINSEFASTDVALVIGANDVVNPAARLDPGSPIYGMPILNVDQAKQVVVLKRGMNPGFAGIENMLFYNPKTLMLFGDARESVQKVLRALDEV
ncbi:MAG: NAD(P)(+) transhydrogenase (Re/Si-specific) subunit beta [Clostridiales bacterium]|nr:NAD(P)(+) transhydrogenase (Re/Si-specific) subunit beta [Clostridiales bacterium]